MNRGSTFGQGLRAWGRRHSYSLFSSFGALVENRVGTLITALVLGLAMALPLALHVATLNLSRVDLGHQGAGALTVFLNPGTDTGVAEALGRRVEARAGVASVEMISPEAGLDEFRRASGFGPALDLLESNPLPWVLSVVPGPIGDESGNPDTEALATWLQTQAEVESVSFDAKWLQRLARIVDLGRALAGVLAVLFSLTAVVVVANTIRLDVAARAEEIEVFLLVGATDGFIRVPFLYAGLWYGLLGSLVALILVSLGLEYLEAPLGRLVDLYGQSAALAGLGIRDALVGVGAAGFLGVLGAWIAVGMKLRQLRG